MRSILATVGHKSDRKVLKRAAELAREQSARLTIVSVVEDHWLEAADISEGGYHSQPAGTDYALPGNRPSVVMSGEIRAEQ